MNIVMKLSKYIQDLWRNVPFKDYCDAKMKAASDKRRKGQRDKEDFK